MGSILYQLKFRNKDSPIYNVLQYSGLEVKVAHTLPVASHGGTDTLRLISLPPPPSNEPAHIGMSRSAPRLFPKSERQAVVLSICIDGSPIQRAFLTSITSAFPGFSFNLYSFNQLSITSSRHWFSSQDYHFWKLS